jgi:hypothetical protein
MPTTLISSVHEENVDPSGKRTPFIQAYCPNNPDKYGISSGQLKAAEAIITVTEMTTLECLSLKK